MQNMYPGKVNSPKTIIVDAITATATSITVDDASVFPSAPNLAVIGTSEIAETILYTVKNNNVLSGITRGFQGTARQWGAETIISRNFTAYDHDATIANIAEVKQDAATAQSSADTAQSTATAAGTAASAAQGTANSHKARHATGGADAITPASIGAATTAEVAAAASAAAAAKTAADAAQETATAAGTAAAAAQSTANSKADKSIQKTFTISATWTGTEAPYTQTVTVSGVTTDTGGDIGLADTATKAQRDAARAAQLWGRVTANNTITIYADGEPSEISLPGVVRIGG